MEIGWNKKNHYSHTKMDDFSDDQTADAEFSCKQFSQEHEQQTNSTLNTSKNITVTVQNKQ